MSEGRTPYQLMPALSSDEYAALKADIEKRGVLVPVEKDERGNILDGHHRVQICEELGITDYPRILRLDFTEEQKRLHVRALNLNRRHLTREQRRDLIAAQLRETPEKSDRQIAEGLKVSPTTVGDVRALSNLDNAPRLTKDGRTYPAHRQTSTAKPVYAPTAHAEEKAIAKATAGDIGRSGDEWYTPPQYIEAARKIMGEIDLDPASNAIAQRIICANYFFDEKSDGLKHQWFGRIWLNPPFSSVLIGLFAQKLIAEIVAERVKEAIVLTNNATDTAWFHLLASQAARLCFTEGRISFWQDNPEEQSIGNRQGQTFFYFGPNVAAFDEEFKRFGFLAVCV